MKIIHRRILFGIIITAVIFSLSAIAAAFMLAKKQNPETPTLAEETIIFQSTDNLSRPEMCIIGNRAYVSMRHRVGAVTPMNNGIEIAMKIFDIDANGNWADSTRGAFDDDYFVLYPANGEEGNFTDHQMACDTTSIFLAFETHTGQGALATKHVVVQRRSLDGTVQKTLRLFEGSRGLEKYKMDDPGFALINDNLFIWVVALGAEKRADAFALYGLDAKTLAVTMDDGAGVPKMLDNSLAAPFAGVMNWKNDQYHLLSSPHDQTQNAPFAMNGLVDYVYDDSWNFVRADRPTSSFENAKLLYTTGRIPLENNGEVWGFLVRPNETTKVDNTIDDQNMGEAWLRVVDEDTAQKYVKISGNDGAKRSDDTRHIELARWHDFIYVGYSHLDDDATTVIKKIRLPQK